MGDMLNWLAQYRRKRALRNIRDGMAALGNPLTTEPIGQTRAWDFALQLKSMYYPRILDATRRRSR